MKLALCAAMSLAAACGLAHAELTIWQVENNPPGADSGSEWLTIINMLIRDLDRENHRLKVAIEYLQAVLSNALNMINGLLGTGR